MQSTLSRPFLITLVILTLIACYFIYKPFLTIMIIAAILVTIFYKAYEKLATFLGGRNKTAAFLMCLILLILIILPTIQGLIYFAGKSSDVYVEAKEYFNNHSLSDVLDSPLLSRLGLSEIYQGGDNDAVKNIFLDFLQKFSDQMVTGATAFVVGTTNFIVSLIFIILTMFFFFIDGKKMAHNLMHLSPLQNKYDKEIFKKFKEVSYTTIISTFVVALFQGIVGGLCFSVVGFPGFLAGVIIALLSLLPYVGSSIFYVPVGIYYLLIGETLSGIWLLASGFFIISIVDEFIRAWIIKGKAQINPIFIVFSVLGGISLFGFWGVVLGPLFVSVAATVLHIYSLEFAPEVETIFEEAEDEAKEKAATKKKMTNKICKSLKSLVK